MAEEKNKVGFILKKIVTEQFAIIESSYCESITVDLKAGLKFGINFDKRILSVIFSTSLIQENSPFLVLDVGCYFEINEEAWKDFNKKDSTDLIVPRGFISHLVMLTIGTARGVLHSKTEKTPFNNYLLPTINVFKMVESDIVFSVDDDKKNS